MQSTQSDDDFNDVLNEENLIKGLVTHDDMSKQTNDDVLESNIEVLRSSKTLHIAPYKKDTNSRLDTTVQHDSKNNDSDNDVSDIVIDDKKLFMKAIR